MNELSRTAERGSDSESQASFFEEDSSNDWKDAQAVKFLGDAQASSTPPKKAHMPAQSASIPSQRDYFVDGDVSYFLRSIPRPSRPLYHDPPYKGEVTSHKVYPDFIQFQNLYMSMPDKQKDWVADPLLVWENKPETVFPRRISDLQSQVAKQAAFTFATYTVCLEITVVSLVGIRWDATMFKRGHVNDEQIPNSQGTGYRPLFIHNNGVYDLCPTFKVFYRSWVKTLGWDCPVFTETQKLK